MRMSQRRTESGLSLMELVIALAILAVLASVVIPLSEVTVARVKEVELKRTLRDIRNALDNYKKDYDLAIEKKKIFVVIGETGYPGELRNLVQGNDWGGLYPFKKKYLRKIPVDPFDRDEWGWGLRSYADEPDTGVWGGEDIYNIYSQSNAIALDGTYYRDW